MRRRVFLGGTLLLGGCGFRPLYMPQSGAKAGVSAELAAVYVTLQPERTGQLMRQALQQRLEGASSGVAKKYELTAGFSLSSEGIGIQRDSSTTFIRVNGSANWALRGLGLDKTVLASGNARITDGMNILNQQYFALDLESNAVYRRMAEALADQVVTQVAVYLRRREQGAA